MFHTIREYLVVGIASIRSKKLIGLFAFEVTVVLFGVLSAQGVQNWSRDLDTRRETREAEARLERSSVEARRATQAWRAALPCLRERVVQIMVSAGEGRDVTPDMTQRPLFPWIPGSKVPEETHAGLVDLVGEERTRALTAIPARAAIIFDTSNEIIDRWEIFRLMDPSFGPVSGADRAASREAGAEIISRMRAIEASLASIERFDRQLAVKDTLPFDPVNDILPVRNCDEIWAKGTAFRYADPGEKPYH